MRSLSVDFYDKYRAGVKFNDNIILEDLDKKIVDVVITQARVYRNYDQDCELINRDWYQLKCEFVFSDRKTGRDVSRYIGFERRPIDKLKKSWRIFYMES